MPFYFWASPKGVQRVNLNSFRGLKFEILNEATVFPECTLPSSPTMLWDRLVQL